MTEPSHELATEQKWRDHYSGQRVQTTYRSARLQPPEQRLFDLLATELTSARVLDVGVGAGRTTVHLAPRCRHYTAVDLLPAMVHACQQRFAGETWHRPDMFVQADVCALPYDTASFDLLLFSFNGIDHVPPALRPAALRECRRVLRTGGAFIYSSHNLNWFDSAGLLPRRGTLRTWWGDTQHRRLMRSRNDVARTRGLAQAMLCEPAHFGELYYARPAEHLAQTQQAGFDARQVFCQRGLMHEPGPTAHGLRDPWLYYLAR